jgi:hypothetical protein
VGRRAAFAQQQHRPFTPYALPDEVPEPGPPAEAAGEEEEKSGGILKLIAALGNHLTPFYTFQTIASKSIARQMTIGCHSLKFQKFPISSKNG